MDVSTEPALAATKTTERTGATRIPSTHENLVLSKHTTALHSIRNKALFFIMMTNNVRLQIAEFMWESSHGIALFGTHEYWHPLYLIREQSFILVKHRRQGRVKEKRMSKGGKGKGNNGNKHSGGITFTKNVPRFLQQYSSMLTINKKNFLNEKLGDDSEDVYCEGNFDEDGPVIVKEKNEYIHESEISGDKSPIKDNKEIENEQDNTETAESEDNGEGGKIYFKCGKRKANSLEADNISNRVKVKLKSSVNKSLLSFNEDDES
eukprot:gene10960-22895_t